eukprot:INCI17497.1.p1 GENE.INCI17497.1~~INCI17497.1.p1  ORF type:complete len:452 (-),score=45.86 INCI17497.1:259-1518(-)
MATLCVHSASRSMKPLSKNDVFADSAAPANQAGICQVESSASTATTSSEPQYFLTLLNETSGVLPKKVHINRCRRTKVTIGRGDEADVQVRVVKKKLGDRICVSRMHCEIEKNPRGEWALFDQGSRNGCFVNGVKVSSTVLQDGDVIVLGGGGIIQSGARVQNVESIFQYRFTKCTGTPKNLKIGVKRKLSLDSAGPSSVVSGGCSKRLSLEKENCHNHSKSECASPARAAISDQLRDELSCGICLEVQVHPRGLSCGHSFCCRCISTALSYQNRCPSCKTVVVAEPARVVSLENVICNIYRNNVEYMTRRQEYEKLSQHERITSEKLCHVISKARSSGKRFLEVTSKWNKQEKKVFEQGVALYKGQARLEYCRTVGLTDSFVNNATPHELAMAAMNVGVSATSDCSVQNRLRMFIKFG